MSRTIRRFKPRESEYVASRKPAAAQRYRLSWHPAKTQAVFEHARKRLMERYGKWITRGTYEHMNRAIREGYRCAEFLRDVRRSGKAYLLDWVLDGERLEIIAVWAKEGAIVTFLLPYHAQLSEGDGIEEDDPL